MKKKKIQRKKNIVQDYVEALLFAFVVAMIIRNYTFQNFMIPSSSMESTMLIGDYLVANKLGFLFTDPEAEDIVTFRYPADPVEPQPPENYTRLLGPIYWNHDSMFFAYHAPKNVVKRVIGMPGDSIRIVDQRVYVNGEPMIRDYEQHVDPQNWMGRNAQGELVENQIVWSRGNYPGADVNFGDYEGQEMGTRDNFGPVIVPEDSFFVLGDNRDRSLDSRYWGFLDRRRITGSPLLIFFSIGEEPIKNMREYAYVTNMMRQGKKPPSRIRWERFFKIIK